MNIIYANIRVATVAVTIALAMASGAFADYFQELGDAYNRANDGEPHLFLLFVAPGGHGNVFDLDGIEPFEELKELIKKHLKAQDAHLAQLQIAAEERTDHFPFDVHFRNAEEAMKEMQERDRHDKEAYKRVNEGKAKKGDEEKARRYVEEPNPAAQRSHVKGKKR